MDQGWYPDPSGVHEHRWWTGTAWTDHVADRGAVATDPLPPPPGSVAAEQGVDVVPLIEAAGKDLAAALQAVAPGEHPGVELSTAAAAASQTLEMLVADPGAEAFGLGFPDDDGSRFARAAELHRHRSSLRPEGVPSCARVLAFHTLLVLTGDPGACSACAGPLGLAVPDEREVATALAATYWQATRPPQDEHALMAWLLDRFSRQAWDPEVFDNLHGHLRTRLLPPGIPEVGDDAAQLLWAALNSIIEVYALALYPGLVQS